MANQNIPSGNRSGYRYQQASRASAGMTNPGRTTGSARPSSPKPVQKPSQQHSASKRTPNTRAVTVRKAPEKKESALSYWKKIFKVDPKLIEERNIVREKGSYDYVFLIIVLIMLAFGTIMVYSASYVSAQREYNDSYYIIFRQFIFIMVGFIGMFIASRLNPEFYKRFAVIIYGFCFVLLMAVPVIGTSHHGAKRWLNLGFTEIQPSEFMKFGLVVLLAWYFDRYYERINQREKLSNANFYGNVVPLALTALTCGMIIIERHLSCTIIMMMIGIIIIVAGGARLKLLAALAAAGGVGLFIFALVTNYTKRRIDIWLHPEHDPLGDGWQTLQGLYAIGSGGFFGVGLGESRQKHMYVSEPQNDYIFSIICEELGFIGALAVILLFALFAWRGFRIALKAPDTFSSLVVIGIVGKVITQALFNIAVVTNTIPNTGISLPFFSYGGSSLCVLMTEMGVVLSISRFSRQQK